MFGPPRAAVPVLAEVEHHRPGDAATHMLVSHLALRDGAWPVLGRGAFDPAEWPVVEPEAGRRPLDGLLGTRAAETTLRRLFGL